jgi:predicted acylesterase/phospholipase RssA
MAYACGTLPQLKDHALRFDQESFKDLLGKASVNKRGLYSMDNVEELFRFYSRGLRFDEVKPILAFTSVDIDQGKEVLLSMGDIAHAARITCTLPGIFEPVEWGGGQLVDGGLLNIIPLEEVKRFGTDIAIGLNIPGARHIFREEYLRLRKIARFIKKMFSLRRTRKLISSAYAVFANAGYVEIEIEQDESQYQSIFSVLGRCMDLAIEAEKKEYRVDINPHLDFIISPMLPPVHLEGFKQSKYFYDEGRRTGELYISKIRKAMEEYKEKKQFDRSFTLTF